MRIVISMLYEHFRTAVIESYAPEPDSVVARLLAEADELEAHRNALQPSRTEASERARDLEQRLNKPRPLLGVGVKTPAAKAREQLATELSEALAAESAIESQLSDLTRAVKARQKEIISLLAAPAVSERATAVARESVLRGTR